ncbi:hypothetical protein ACQEVB_07185 [Pseudonocardia sp. CA-107938]|uniref:hypothetical protein n=1 Tax=Pseudonocardia sp. CA-107938 TaxID=3240021 RepID=UPI003D8E9943
MTAEPDDLLAKLAELDEGLVDGEEAGPAELLARRAELAAEPGHAAAVDALAATRADLAAVPPVPLPAATADRWSALVEELHDQPDTPRWRLPVVLTAVAAALVVVAIVAGALVAPARPTVSAVQLAGAALATQDVFDVGELADPDRRAECLAAVAPEVRPTAKLIGGRQVVYEGRPATLLLLGTGQLGRFTAAVVEDGCRRLLTQRDVP